MNWDDVCKTKNEGGLGIKIIEDLAEAVAVKLTWNFLQEDSTWAKWMYNKYCKNTNFWMAVSNNNASNTWKFFLKSRKWCNGRIDTKIVNGETTNIWTNPWSTSPLWWRNLVLIPCLYMVALTEQFPLL